MWQVKNLCRTLKNCHINQERSKTGDTRKQAMAVFSPPPPPTSRSHAGEPVT